MPWLLLLHIIFLLFWFGTVLYLPALLYGFASRSNALETDMKGPEDGGAPTYSDMPRQVFTLFSTPLALLAIVSGTAVFLVHNTVAVWLVAKLTLVSALVICHCLIGGLIVLAENGHRRWLKLSCLGTGATSAVLILGILWLVLAKPFQEGLL